MLVKEALFVMLYFNELILIIKSQITCSQKHSSCQIMCSQKPCTKIGNSNSYSKDNLYHTLRIDNDEGDLRSSCCPVSHKRTLHGCQKKNNVELDRLSCLPNDLLYHIISLLPLQSAAQTRLFSTQWNSLWKTTSVQHGPTQSMSNAVITFLNNIDWINPTRAPWKLEYYSVDNHSCSHILQATTGAKNKFHLDFSRTVLDFPWRYFMDLELIEEIGGQQQAGSRHGSPALLSYPHYNDKFRVKSLYLTAVNYLSCDMVEDFVMDSVFLERIEIKACRGLYGLSINAGSKLRELSIIDCPQLGSISLLAHKLKSFRFRGKFPEIFIIGLSCFDDIMLDFREGPGYEEFQCIESHSLLMLFLKEAEHITLCQWTFEVMIRPRIALKDDEVLQFDKLKELWWIDSSVEEDHVDSLISFLQLCPSLEKLFITIDPACYYLPSKGNRRANQVLSTTEDRQQLCHLKMVKIEGLSNQDDKMLLIVGRILKIVAEEPVFVTTSKCGVQRHPNNSIYKLINPTSRKFVNEVDSSILSSIHVHM